MRLLGVPATIMFLCGMLAQLIRSVPWRVRARFLDSAAPTTGYLILEPALGLRRACWSSRCDRGRLRPCLVAYFCLTLWSGHQLALRHVEATHEDA